MSGHPKHGAAKSAAPVNATPRPKEARRKEIRADFLLAPQQQRQSPPSYQRPQGNHYAPPLRRSGPSGARRAPASFGKGRFVQSNFRIFVDEMTPDVVEATLNADALLDWSSVRRVDLQQDTLLKCPICLDEDMVVPKITRCGHVFCAACIMRYFQSLQEYNGKFLQKCPVCAKEQISPDELISVRLELVKPPREGDRLRFILARRTASSTVVRPPPGLKLGDRVVPGVRRNEDHPWSLPLEGQVGAYFSRLVRLAPGHYARMLADEVDTLQAFRIASRSCGDTELLPSIDAAMKLLEQLRSARGEEAEQDFEPLPAPADAVEGEDVEDWERHEEEEEEDEDRPGAELAGSSSALFPAVPGSPSTAAGAPAGPAGGCSAAPASPSPSRPSPNLSAAPGTPSKSDLGCGAGSAVPKGAGPRSHLISFFQAEDGRPIFLQPVFTKMLLHEHEGAWEKLPMELPVLRVERVQNVTVDDELRRRHRFLSHLPLGSQISFSEVDMRSVLSKATKEAFAMEFEKLREQRKKDLQKSRKEDRISKSRAEAEEEQLYTALNRVHPRDYVPQVVPTKEDFVPLPGSRAALAAEANGGDRDAAADAEEVEEDQGPTLAMLLKEKMSGRGRQGKGGGRSAKAAAPPPPADSESWGPALSSLGSKAKAPKGGAAWGRGRGSDRAPGTADQASSSAAAGAASSEAPAEPYVMPESWDSDEDQPPALAALDAALRSAATAPAEASGAGAEQPEGPGEDAEEVKSPSGAGQGKKGKKGKAKPKTIRLFG